MNTSLKHALIIFPVSLGIFWLIKPKGDKMEGKKSDNDKREPLPIPKASDEQLSKHSRAEDAVTALKAYVMAYNAGEDKYTLDELKDTVKQEMGLTIYEKPSGKLAVKDIEGYDIIVNQ